MTLRELITRYYDAKREQDASQAAHYLACIEHRMIRSEHITLAGDDWKAPDVVPKNVVPFGYR